MAVGISASLMRASIFNAIPNRRQLCTGPRRAPRSRNRLVVGRIGIRITRPPSSRQETISSEPKNSTSVTVAEIRLMSLACRQVNMLGPDRKPAFLASRRCIDTQHKGRHR
jgi:hypothetical protein